MSWTAFHSRGETLHVVVDTANRRRDGVLPMQLPGVAENFTDEVDLVGALLLKWHARLSGNLERALMREPLDLESAVAAAWLATAEQLPGVRLVLDRCVMTPSSPEMARAMDRATEREWLRLAAAAGLANDESPRAVEAGRRVEAQARLGMAPVADTPVEPEKNEKPAEPTTDSTNDTPLTTSFVDRIKAALAA